MRGTTTDVDVGLVADIRFPGGTSTALLHELSALRQVGASCALVQLDASVLSRGRLPNLLLADRLSELNVPVLAPQDRCRCRLLLAHHPACWQRPPGRTLPLRAEHVALVAHHPAVERDGTQRYDYPTAVANLGESVDTMPVVLPVGPAVRRTLEQTCPELALHEDDWPNLIALQPETPPPPCRDGRLRIGRHSRPDLLKWPTPETARLVYPERADLAFAMLGVDDAIRGRFDPWPANWQALPFRSEGADAFLAGLDAYSYYHDPRWIEAFGYNVLEALAAGLPTIIDPALAETFGPGPIYAAPTEAAAAYEQLRDPSVHQEASRAVRAAAARFGYETMAGRLDTIVGPARSAQRRPRASRRAQRLLVMTSNGTGAGHIMRQIAIARAAGPDVQTVFFTLSKAAGFARAAGFLAEARPHHRRLGMDVAHWNAWLRDELLEAMRFYEPDALVFDGNVPYGGLIEALERQTAIRSVWVRRAMWRRRSEISEARAPRFDAILEPGELAGRLDPGHSRAGEAPFLSLPPILPHPRGGGFTRATARRLLDLPEEAFVLLLALGSGSNRNVEPIRRRVYEAFPEALVVEPRNPLVAAADPLGVRHRPMPIFPVARYLAAFDAGVSAAGYNGFHEAVAAGLPTLFVPNASSEMDLQECRAEIAASAGWALSAAQDDPYGQARGLALLACEGERAAMRATCARIGARFDGAQVAARSIALTARRIRWTA